MECRQVTELLPWFANGSLAPAEADPIARHLNGCEECRRELAETGEAFALFGEHLSTSTLVAMAFDGTTGPVSRTVAESHLESCSSCLEQLALVRRSRRALTQSEGEEGKQNAGAGGRIESFPAPGREAATPWRGLALAASIATLVSTAGWFWTWQGAAGPEMAGATYRGDAALPEAAGEGGEDRPYVPLRDRLTDSAAPELNVPVVRAEPMEGAAGGGKAVSPVPSGSAVVLVLSSRLAGDAPLACRLESADGTEIWMRRGLERRPEGGFTLRFSTDRLEGGRYTLRLLSEEGVELESYLLSIG